MKNSKYLIIGGLFFLVSILFISNYKSLLTFLPVQEVEISNGAAFGPVVKDYLFVQEITLKKRYLNRIDVYLAKIPSQNSDENVFLLLDSGHRILYSKRFSSKEIDGAVFYPFDFRKSLDLGKGNKVYACIYSIDGDANDNLSLPRKANGSMGKLYVVPIQNNDVILTIEKQQSIITFDGSMGLKTFESDSLLFSPLRIVFYILVFIFTLVLIFFRKIKPFILKSKVLPEYAFLGISLVFGFLMVVVTPPFQVPDEPQHLYRSYQIAELNIFKYHDSIPSSLVQLASICNRMKFMAHEKTSKKEILALANIKLNPEKLTTAESPNYIMPYLPQAFGIFIGKLFHLKPLWLFYLGRVFNLLVSVILIFIAIKTTPVLKWLFFMLSIMPMTVYEMSSLSYDALTISLSFLLIATILNYALNDAKVIRVRDILILFLISIILASAKPPYYIIAFSFLIIPVKKFGSWKKFLLVFGGLAATVIVISQLYSPGRQFFEKFGKANKPASTTAMVTLPENPLPDQLQPSLSENPLPGRPQPSLLPQLPHDPQPRKQQNPPASSNQPEAQAQQNQPTQQAQPTPYNPFDPPAQKKFILDDPVRYIGIIFDTFGKFIGLYQISFIGLFGWVDTPLPPFIVYTYLIVLMIIALSSPAKGIKINFLKKGILLGVFLAGFVLVETAMYVYCNLVGSNPITAVQGRYFIAFGPLLFILFYNNIVDKALDNALLSSKDKPIAGKRNQKRRTDVKTNVAEHLYTKTLPWFAIAFGSFALIYSLYLIMTRFYIILI
jgi:uncharacterized membrane protein